MYRVAAELELPAHADRCLQRQRLSSPSGSRGFVPQRRCWRLLVAVVALLGKRSSCGCPDCSSTTAVASAALRNRWPCLMRPASTTLQYRGPWSRRNRCVQQQMVGSLRCTRPVRQRGLIRDGGVMQAELEEALAGTSASRLPGLSAMFAAADALKVRVAAAQTSLCLPADGPSTTDCENTVLFLACRLMLALLTQCCGWLPRQTRCVWRRHPSRPLQRWRPRMATSPLLRASSAFLRRSC